MVDNRVQFCLNIPVWNNETEERLNNMDFQPVPLTEGGVPEALLYWRALSHPIPLVEGYEHVDVSATVIDSPPYKERDEGWCVLRVHHQRREVRIHFQDRVVAEISLLGVTIEQYLPGRGQPNKVVSDWQVEGVRCVADFRNESDLRMQEIAKTLQPCISSDGELERLTRIELINDFKRERRIRLK